MLPPQVKAAAMFVGKLKLKLFKGGWGKELALLCSLTWIGLKTFTGIYLLTFTYLHKIDAGELSVSLELKKEIFLGW